MGTAEGGLREPLKACIRPAKSAYNGHQPLFTTCFAPRRWHVALLIFRAFREQRKALTEPPYLGSEFDGWPTDSMSNDTDRLVIEGKSISFARYRRYRAKAATDNINQIKKAVSEDFDLTG